MSWWRANRRLLAVGACALVAALSCAWVSVSMANPGAGTTTRRVTTSAAAPTDASAQDATSTTTATSTADTSGNGDGSNTTGSNGSDVPTAAPPTPAPKQHAPTPIVAAGGGTAGGTSSSPTGSGTRTSNGCVITAQDVSGEQHLLSLLNQHRAAAGVPALTLNATLSRASRAHSCDMYQHHTLSHTGSDGSSPFDRMAAVGVSYREAGENIADADGYSLTSALDLDDRDMMAEPLTRGNHHWNIVNRGYMQVGLGVIYINGQTWFTEDFVG